MPSTEISTGNRSWHIVYFEILLSLSQIFGFTMVILSGYFLNIVGDGIKWTNGNENFHGFFMTIGLVFFQGEALLSYRLYRHDIKLLPKLIHVFFHTLAIGLFVTALVAIIQKKTGNQFTTAHSWIGIAIIFIYVTQFLFGIINFIIPGVTMQTMNAFMRLHKIIGSICFIGSIIQAIIGFTQFNSQRSHHSNCSEIDAFTCIDHNIIFNVNIIAVILYAITVLSIVLPPTWKRQKTPDEKK